MPSWNVGVEPLGTVFTGQVTCSGTAVILFATSTQPSISAICVKAFSANTNDVYVGISSVATTTGFVLHPHDEKTFDVDYPRSPLYVISPGTAQAVCYAAIG
jgi:hypothetical protein